MIKLQSLKGVAQHAYLRAGVLVGTALVAVPTFAQETDPFDTALATATTKVGAYAAALVGLGAVAVVFMIALKYVKKIPRAS
ncbi:hypothetical protein [uncultured Hydrogenophaga sp.]|uniref:hypothetical protein n=1 Tax=uncultured Hydrogenophaga sp. TaxID=199683 RepID=UPI00258FD2BD|nr:hypothetical protein [uncultured Hydrogenophaga sp.]